MNLLSAIILQDGICESKEVLKGCNWFCQHCLLINVDRQGLVEFNQIIMHLSAK
jgi:hypothetical protein